MVTWTPSSRPEDPGALSSRRVGGCGRAEAKRAGNGVGHGAGFTLIEIMVVVGIAALLISVAIPAFVQRVSPESIRRAISDLAEICSHARAYAILRGTPSVLTIKRGEGILEVSMVAEAPMPADEAGETVVAVEPLNAPGAEAPTTSGGAVRTLKLNDAIHLGELRVNKETWSDPVAHILFYPNGTCDAFSLNLYSNSGERRNLWVESVTGLATVEPDTSKFNEH